MYEDYENYEEAVAHFEKGLEVEEQIAKKIYFLCRLYKALNLLGNQSEAAKTLEKAKKLQTEIDDGYQVLLENILGLGLDIGDNLVELALLEAYLSKNPEDDPKRFRLAQQYSKLKKHENSFHHYNILATRSPDSGNLNNLGVEANYLGLKGYSIDAYQQAASYENKIAIGNIAFKFIRAGFFKEAENLCKPLLAEEKIEPHVLSAYSHLQEIAKEEQQKLSLLSEQKEELECFLKQCGQAYLRTCTFDLEATFKAKNCDFTVKIHNGTFSANGSYTDESSSNVGLGLMIAQGRLPQPIVKYEISYNGIVNGSVVSFQKSIKRTPKSARVGLLGGLLGEDKPSSGLMLVSEDKNTIKVYEHESGTNGIFYDLENFQKLPDGK